MKKKLIALGSFIAVDSMIIALSFILAYQLRLSVLPALFPKFLETPLLPFFNFLNHAYFVVIWLIVFSLEKLYTKRYPFWQETKILFKSLTLSTFVIMIIIFLTRTHVRFSRTIVILAWFLSMLLLPVVRSLTKLLLIKLKLWQKNLLIVGVHQTSMLIVECIKKNKTMGYEVLGFLDDDPRKLGRLYAGVRVLGPISELENITKQYQSKDIMISTPHLPRKQLKEIFTQCENISESMWMIPRTGDFITEGVEIEILGDVLTLYIKKNLAKPWNIFIKSIFEKSLVLLSFVILLPVFALIALAIKLDSQGPVIFKQQRIGKNKELFLLYKFRSMHTNSDELLEKYFKSHPKAKDEWQRYKKMKNHDPRVTRVGRIIRKISLDELPQFINVLTGTMNLVGPRPYLPEELKGKDTFINVVTQVKPGITGPWQVSGRSELSFEKRLHIDEYYIRNWSLWIDIVILLKSLKVLVFNKGAY